MSTTQPCVRGSRVVDFTGEHDRGVAEHAIDLACSPFDLRSGIAVADDEQSQVRDLPEPTTPEVDIVEVSGW